MMARYEPHSQSRRRYVWGSMIASVSQSSPTSATLARVMTRSPRRGTGRSTKALARPITTGTRTNAVVQQTRAPTSAWAGEIAVVCTKCPLMYAKVSVHQAATQNDSRSARRPTHRAR
jgi:hypothetical protein